MASLTPREAVVLRVRRRMVLGLASLICLAACSAPPACSPRPLSAGEQAPVPEHFPGPVWQPVPAARAGFDAQALAQALQGVDRRAAMMVVRNGREVARVGDVARANYTASVRKSVLSLLIGQAVARGELSLDATLAELGIDDEPPLLPEERQARVRDLVMARSGVYHLASNPGDATAAAPARGTQRPGSYFLYNNWDFNALGTILSRAAGTGVYELLARDLAAPLQFQDFSLGAQRLEGDRSRSLHPAYPMQLSTRDLARLGHLALARGQWAGRQVVPAAWVDVSTSTLTPPGDLNPPAWREEGLGYGYLWWTVAADPASTWRGAFAAQGAGGQYLLVLPALGLVMAHEVPEASGTRVSWPQFASLACRISNAVVAR